MAEAPWDEVERLLVAIVDGEAGAWEALQAVVHGELVRLARLQPIGRLRGDVDAAHEIALRVLDRMHARELAAIRRWAASEVRAPVRAWIRVLVRTTAIDYMRQHADYVRGSTQRAPGWVSLATWASRPGAQEPPSLLEKRRDLERFIARVLEDATRAQASSDDPVSTLALAWKVAPIHARRVLKHGARYAPVLELVLAGYSYPEIAAKLACSRREVELVVEYIEELVAVRGFAVIGS